MRERGNFGEAAEGEGEGFGVGSEGFAGRGAEWEIEEDFVDNEGEMVFLAKTVQASELFGLDVGAGGIVRVDQEDGAGTRGDGVFEGLEIDEPAVGLGD